ncbi:MAG: saccharopine dehydrogenase family protein [Leptolyngbya sp. PLA3]|nr:MAG: saccharopine dehydrogenase family protein [Cyanobacteria bacterium CYA]MCE7968520.1 saccharopine dehydrogenase family protein [Leptolyngbya sp. PL-A3]
MPHAIVLGAGMVGSVMSADLSSDPAFEVTVADARPQSLELASRRSGGRVRTLQLDLSDTHALARAIAPFDIVLGALASHLGFQTLRTVIEAKKNYADISFMPEDALELDQLAKKNGVTAVVDCGVAPGMSNLLSGYAVSLLDSCDNIEIYVGGLPRERCWPFQYKAGFAPADVIEEYTRPVRIVENGRTVIRQALTEPELLDFPGIGSLEAVNTDGLRSLAATLPVPSMKEKTLRYPGHYELMRVLRAIGLFSKEPVDVNGVCVRPLDLLSTLMFPMWTYQPGEPDLTVMRVLADGTRDGRRLRLAWDLLDQLDPATGFTSMSRTTAFPCAIMARRIASGRLARPGVLPPERLADDHALVADVLDQLDRRGVRFLHSERELPR